MPTVFQLPLAVQNTATTAITLVKGGHTPVDATAGPLTVNLPAVAVGNAGRIVSVEKVDASANAVTVSGNIRGSAATFALQLQFQSIEFVADAAGSWRPRTGHVTMSSLDKRLGAFYMATAAGTRVNNVVTFGAKGDNVTDDTAAIQAAINAGGITYFPPGNYMVTNLTLLSGSLLRGDNAGAPGIIPGAAQRSCLRRTDTATGNFITIPTGAGVGKIERLEIDARSRPGNGIHFTDFPAGEEAQWKLDDLYIHDTAITAGAFADGDGIYVGTGRRAASFRNVQAYSCGRYGFNIQGSDTKWTHCSAAANGWDGWVTNAGATRILGGDNYGNGGAAAALASSAVSGVAIAGTSPTAVTTVAAHGLLTGMRVLITGAVGVSGQVNMAYPVTVVDATHFTIPTTNTTAWTSGGTVRPMANGLWHRGGAGVTLTQFGCDRNQMSGIFCDIGCGNISIDALLTSNGKQADGAWANIEINSQNNAVTLKGVLFQPQVGGQSQRPWYDVLTRNSSTWKETGIVQSGSTSSGVYTNFAAGQRGQVFSNTANAASGYLQLDAAAHVALAQLTPGLPFDVESTDGGTTWTYGGVTVTSRPTGRTDVRMQCVTNGTTMPAWAITGDRLLKVP